MGSFCMNSHCLRKRKSRKEPNKKIPTRPWNLFVCLFACVLVYTYSVFAKGPISYDNNNYYSFKIFPQFWLAKSTRIIHHNQLLMTKFGRILYLTRKWCQKCSPLQVKVPLSEKTWGRGWVVFVVKTKMADISLVSRVRTTAGTRWNNG